MGGCEGRKFKEGVLGNQPICPILPSIRTSSNILDLRLRDYLMRIKKADKFGVGKLGVELFVVTTLGNI